MNKTLKPCPFCGGKADIHRIPVNTIVKFEVNCGLCFASLDHYFQSEETAIKAWNTRLADKEAHDTTGMYPPDLTAAKQTTADTIRQERG